MTVARSPHRLAFTLTELMVAVVVLVGILLAIGKIFSTTSKVTGVGQATTDVMQEVAAFGQQLRDDLERLTSEGVFAIRCVAVPNNINSPTLLNPSLSPDAIIRSDQLVFFTNARQGVSTFRTGSNARQPGNANVARIYYGHAYQLGDAGRASEFTSFPRAYDIEPETVVFPWSNSRIDGSFDAVYTRFPTSNQPSGGTTVFSAQSALTIDIAQVDARKWLLVRQPVLLADDDYGNPNGNNKTRFLGDVLTARSVFWHDPVVGTSPQIRDGRVDAAATEMDDIRRHILFTPAGGVRPWRNPGGAQAIDQYSIIMNELVYYPRAERFAPSMNRIDQALTNHVLGTACSSIRIEWTYEPATGWWFLGDQGQRLGGVDMNLELPQQWFGLPVAGQDVVTYTDFSGVAQTIYPQNIETLPSGGEPFDVYTAAFGFNRSVLLDTGGLPNPDLGYTPWPSAIRVTLTLHDSRTELEGGRDVQFVIKLPKRTQPTR